MKTNKLVISRQLHRKGGADFVHTYGPTALLNDNGLMCCLGFAAKQLYGLTDDQIRGIELPADVAGNPMKEFTNRDPDSIETPCGVEFVDIHNTICRELIVANDSTTLSEHERELQIIALFSDLGIECTFVD